MSDEEEKTDEEQEEPVFLLNGKEIPGEDAFNEDGSLKDGVTMVNDGLPTEEPVEEHEEPEEEPEEELLAFQKEEEPTGKTDKAMYWLMRGMSDEDIVETKGLNRNTVRMARGWLADNGYLKKERKPSGVKSKTPGAALQTQSAKGTLQVFAKGSPPEAIIENIHVPEIDGQSASFETGMKFGMSTIVLAVRLMQELSIISAQQVKPLIDMTRSVREGEGAAFKSGADEAAMKAASAMGATIMPIMSEMQSAVINATKGSEPDPMKAMMVRTMEPLMKNMMGGIIPGMKDEPPTGWSRKEE